MSNTTKNISSDLLNERECMRSMAEEIREGIFNLSAGEIDKAVVENEVEEIIGRSALHQHSEAAVGLLLFRKYADIANDIKSEKHNQTRNSFDLTAFDPSALVLHDINEDKLVGTLALGEKIFLLRVFTSLLAFISMIVMATIPGIVRRKLCPANHFNWGCNIGINGDCFRQEPYMFVIVTAAILIPHNLFFAFYYLLPINDEGKKYLPGVCVLLGFPSNITPLFDATLLLLSFLAGIAGSITLQIVQHYHIYRYDGNITREEQGYYTIASFYAEFSHKTPTCFTSVDPSPRMTASITMMYFATCLMGLCFAQRGQLSVEEKITADDV